MASSPIWIILLVVVIIIALVITFRQRREGIQRVSGMPARPPTTPLANDPALAVRQLLDAGNKIEAIKLVRQQTGLGLKEAKDYVEGLGTAEIPILSQHSHPTATPVVAGDLNAQIHALIAQGQKIEAIKLVRQHTGLGLKEAKEYVEALEPNN